MTTFARDCSNYTTDNFTPELIESWRASGVGLVIIQAFPPEYTSKYAEQVNQMRVCAQVGMPFDCYIYDYLGAPDWLDGALNGIQGSGLRPRKLWLDEEDTETEVGWTPQQRIDAITSSIERALWWAHDENKLPYPGIYTGGWWWVPKTGNSKLFEDLDLWVAQYDGIADASVFTPFGGWTSCRIKQYAGTQPDGTDLNVLSVEEEAELNGGVVPVNDTELKVMQDKINGLVSSLGYIAGDLLAPVVKQKTASKAVQRLIAGIRSQAEQQGIKHA